MSPNITTNGFKNQQKSSGAKEKSSYQLEISEMSDLEENLS